SGKGSKITDIDGNEYIDYVLSWGPLLLGHAQEQVVQKLKSSVEKGTSFGSSTTLENRLAELVIERAPSVEMVRMVNSGRQATTGGLRLAAEHTGRHSIGKFAGRYPGHGDSLLTKAGSGVATLGVADSRGVPGPNAKNTMTGPYND